MLVIGAGAVGFLACALAKALGVSHVAAIDIDGAKLQTLEDAHFADATYCIPLGPRDGTKEEGLARSKLAAIEAARRLESGKGYDVVYECTGVESCIQMAIHVSHFIPCLFAGSIGSIGFISSWPGLAARLPSSAWGLRTRPSHSQMPRFERLISLACSDTPTPGQKHSGFSEARA